jgi:hypothetical protein
MPNHVSSDKLGGRLRCRSSFSNYERRGHFCCPSGNDEEFHEKNVWSLIFSFLHHGMERTIEVPKDA